MEKAIGSRVTYYANLRKFCAKFIFLKSTVNNVIGMLFWATNSKKLKIPIPKCAKSECKYNNFQKIRKICSCQLVGLKRLVPMQLFQFTNSLQFWGKKSFYPNVLWKKVVFEKKKKKITLSHFGIWVYAIVHAFRSLRNRNVN